MALRNQEIGARLRELRGQRPQTVVAEGIGVAERTYQNWEAGDAKPSYRNLQRLAEYYRVGEDFILTGEGSAPTPDPFGETPAIEGALGDVLAEIKAQLARQTEVLDEIKGHASRVERMLTRQEALRDETDEIAETIRRLGREIVEGAAGPEAQPDSAQVPPRRAVVRKKLAAKPPCSGALRSALVGLQTGAPVSRTPRIFRFGCGFVLHVGLIAGSYRGPRTDDLSSRRDGQCMRAPPMNEDA